MTTKTNTGIKVIELSKDRLTEAADILVRGFLDNPNFVHLFPGAGGRARALRHVQRACLRDALHNGRVYAAARGPEMLGVAAWLPPGAFPLPPGRQLRAAPEMIRVLAAAPLSILRLIRFTTGAAKLHPEGPYWYLEAVGVDPPAQGMGVGKKLLEPALARADKDGLPCYLETMTEQNVAWYRRFGFEVVCAAVAFAPGAPPNWTMLRRPRRAA